MTTIMPGAEPFYFKGNSIGWLMVHGFTGTPKEVRWLGERLAGDGHTVLGVRLAGHGTTPEDMNTTRWTHWYASVVEGYRQLRAECQQVFVAGLSLGGLLALRLAAREQPDGIVVMAAPLHIRDWRITAFRPFQRWIPYWGKGPNDFEDGVMGAGHLEYDRFPTACIVSLLGFLKVMQADLPRVTTPTLLIYAKQDGVANEREARFVHQRLAARDKPLILLERGGHIVCEDVERERVLAEVRQFAQRIKQPLMV